MVFGRKKNREGNFLDYSPRRLFPYEIIEDDIVEISIPRFGRNRISRFIQKKYKLNDFKVKLDGVGSFVWQKCDGRSTLYAIGKEMEEHFGEEIQPVYDRLVQFIRQMEHGKLIKVERHELQQG